MRWWLRIAMVERGGNPLYPASTSCDAMVRMVYFSFTGLYKGRYWMKKAD